MSWKTTDRVSVRLRICEWWRGEGDDNFQETSICMLFMIFYGSVDSICSFLGGVVDIEDVAGIVYAGGI